MILQNLKTSALSTSTQTIFEEIRRFDENLPLEFEIVATIDEKSFILENAYSTSDGFLVFSGHEFKTKFPLKFFVTPENLHFLLSAQLRPLELPQSIRRPIGFSAE